MQGIKDVNGPEKACNLNQFLLFVCVLFFPSFSLLDITSSIFSRGQSQKGNTKPLTGEGRREKVAFSYWLPFFLIDNGTRVIFPAQGKGSFLTSHSKNGERMFHFYSHHSLKRQKDKNLKTKDNNFSVPYFFCEILITNAL